MSTAPAHASPSAGRHQALYHNTLQEAARAGQALMGVLVHAASQVLQAQQADVHDAQEGAALSSATSQLRQHAAQLCALYSQALLHAFAGPQGGKKSHLLSVAEVHFDHLESMDPEQLQTRITLARIQQAALHSAQASLYELDTLMCSLLGLGTVRPDHNPLRPEIYVNALKDAVEQTQASAGVALLWLGAMSAALGPQLHAQYLALNASLRHQGVAGVAGAAYTPQTALAPAPDSASADDVGGDLEAVLLTMAAPLSDDSGAAPGAQGRDAKLLTLDKLRQLLTGELLAPSARPLDAYAAQFARQFEAAAAADPAAGRPLHFDATVPAALEALTEMQQVEQVMHSLEQRRSQGFASADVQAQSLEGQRLALRQSARGVAQALSLEVVTLMVDKMARDPRLLAPVCAVIRSLEPALLRLALVDPRFFIDKQHPARLLLHELTHRSLAFESSSSSGFDNFLVDLQGVLMPLLQAPIEDADIFERKLQALRLHWSRETQATERARAAAVEVLQHAEARNLLAEDIAHQIAAHPDAAKVPTAVMDFLCGPWAQVVAQARIKQGAGSPAAEQFEALTPALLWSAHPDLASASPAKLTRLVPRLLATLREGLETIHYPATRTSVFLETLMAIHQQAFRPAPAPAPALAATAPARVPVLVDDDPWIAPEEALASNFVALPEGPEAAAPQHALAPAGLLPVSGLEAVVDGELALGAWVEMWASDQWQRTQLTWASPHGTLFLFTSVFGTTQSMTRRSRDKLLASGHLRLVSGQAVDEGALDAVVQTAMRNSVDGLS